MIEGLVTDPAVLSLLNKHTVLGPTMRHVSAPGVVPSTRSWTSRWPASKVVRRLRVHNYTLALPKHYSNNQIGLAPTPMACKYILSIDQGTTSTRVILFDQEAHIMCHSQHKHSQIIPQPGYLEHSAEEIFAKVQLCMADIAQQMQRMHIPTSAVACCGIACQRETVVVWDKQTGVPLCNAIVWSDTRTKEVLKTVKAEAAEQGVDIGRLTGLNLSTYFSGAKVRWLVENDPEVRQRLCVEKTAVVGTIDSWILFRLTQYNPEGPVHSTDVTNASRTLLFNIETLQWDENLCRLFKVPSSQLPTVYPSGHHYGDISLKQFHRVPIMGIIGDQQASLFGHCCFSPGSSKCTFGTGAFMLLNIGETLVYADNGLLTTIAYQVSGERAVYAHEGSIATAGAALEWLVEIGVIKDIGSVDSVAESVPDNGNVTFIPAFSGLFCPRWRSDARGVILGITQHTSQGHIVRAVLEAICMEVGELLQVSGENVEKLSVDGGIVQSRVFQHMLARLCGLTVLTSEIVEITALGAALLAGSHGGVYSSIADAEKAAQRDLYVAEGVEDEDAKTIRENWSRLVERSYGLASNECE